MSKNATLLPIRTQALLMDEIAQGDLSRCYEVKGPKIVIRIYNWQDRAPAVKFADAFGETITVAPTAGRNFYDRAAMFGIPSNFAARTGPRVNQLVSVPGISQRVRVWGVTFDWSLNATAVTIKAGKLFLTFPADQVR